MPAEYEPHHGTLMIWPTRPGSWPYQGKAAKRLSARLLKRLFKGNLFTFWWPKTILTEAQDYLGDRVVYLDTPYQ